MKALVKEKIMSTIMNALKEDIGTGDITTTLLFENEQIVVAEIVAGEDCILCGMDVVRWVFTSIDPKMVFNFFCKDGDPFKKGKSLMSIRGTYKNILSCERTALNFLGRLSGVATFTNKFVTKVKDTQVKIFDTRKTSPGLRELEKYAVKVGGGVNHRMGLWDGVLIKDNHLALLSIRDALLKVTGRGYRDIEVEVETLEQFKEALEEDAGIMMLDNMKLEDIKEAVRLRDSKRESGGCKTILEVSGGVNLENVQKIAKTGVDRISIGSLTQKAPSIDFSLKIDV